MSTEHYPYFIHLSKYYPFSTVKKSSSRLGASNLYLARCLADRQICPTKNAWNRKQAYLHAFFIVLLFLIVLADSRKPFTL